MIQIKTINTNAVIYTISAIRSICCTHVHTLLLIAQQDKRHEIRKKRMIYLLTTIFL